MSSPHILLPSYTVVHPTTADLTGRTSRTVIGYLPGSGTLPSLSYWQTLDSSIPTSKRSPHNLPPPAPRSRHVTQARRAKVARLPEVASQSCSGSTALNPLTVLDLTSPGAPSAPLLTEKKRTPAVQTTAPPKSSTPVVAPSPSILEAWPSYDSIEDAAQCLVYRSVDDWLPTSTSTPPPPPPPCPRQRSPIRPSIRISERNLNLTPEAAFSSNMALPMRNSPWSAPRILPGLPDVHPNPPRAFFGFAALTQSLARLSGELAAFAVAGYQNCYGDPSVWKQGGEKGSFGWKWKSEWEEDMRALEMEEWIVDGNAL